jgi:hypothetical protein
MPDPTKPDVFPLTRGTWINDRIRMGDAGRAEINRHVMSVYHWPLTVYFRGTRDRTLGEPDDVVQGFFASRLGKSDFFTEWQRSGKRLRHWLINGFCFFLKELRRDQRRRASSISGLSPSSPVFDEPSDSDDATAARDMDKVFLRGVVREAMIEASRVCEQLGLGKHFEIFEAHFYMGQPYEVIADRYGLEPTRAAVMARTANRKFQGALRELFLKDGTEANRIEEEIADLLGIAGVSSRKPISGGEA